MPSASTRPSRSRTTRPISGTISSMWWVTSTRVTPCRARSRRVTSRCPRATRSRPVLGSSSNSACGRLTRARAISTRRASPVDSSAYRRLRSGSARTRSSASSARARCSSVMSRNGGTTKLANRPVSTASSTDSSYMAARLAPKSPVTMPSCARSRSTCQRDWPSTRTGGGPSARASGYSSRVMSLIRVDLPHPLGPSSAVCWPWSMRRLSSWRTRTWPRTTLARSSSISGGAASAAWVEWGAWGDGIDGVPGDTQRMDADAAGR